MCVDVQWRHDERRLIKKYSRYVRRKILETDECTE